MALTTYLANALLGHNSGKTAFTMPTVRVALFSSAPGVGGTGTELSYTGYARRTTAGADWNAPSAGAQTNATEFSFGTKTAGADVTATHWATYDAASGGNMLEFGALTVSKLIQNGDTPKIAAGDLSRTAA
jgi:hypothetical protein